MNYLQTLDAFDKWLETNLLQAESISLWFALVRIANGAGWPEDFTVGNGTLLDKAGLSAGQLKRHRNKLEEIGLIQYVKSENVSQAGTYKLLPIFQSEQQNEPRSEPQGEPRDRPRQNEPHNEPRGEPRNELQDEPQNGLQGAPSGRSSVENRTGASGRRQSWRFDPVKDRVDQEPN